MFNFEQILYSEQGLMSRKIGARIVLRWICQSTKQVDMWRNCTRYWHFIIDGKTLTGGGEEEFKDQKEKMGASDTGLPMIPFFPNLSMQTLTISFFIKRGDGKVTGK